MPFLITWSLPVHYLEDFKDRYPPHPYNFELVKELQSLDHRMCRKFLEWVKNQLEVFSDFHRWIFYF